MYKGIIVSNPVTRTIGASRLNKAFSLILLMSSAATPHERGPSCTIAQRPVFFTEATTVSSSSGLIVLKSSNSMLKSDASSATAFLVSCIEEP